MPLIGILTGDQIPFDHDRSDCMVSQWRHEGSAMSFLNVMINEDQAFRWGGYYQGFVYRWVSATRYYSSANQLSNVCFIHIATSSD